MEWKTLVVYVGVVLGSFVLYVEASRGDNSNEYRGCYHVCHFNNCSSGRDIENFEASQTVSEKLLLWTCDDECKYYCMWRSAKIIMNRGEPVPQYFGKWPFFRLWGLQEPASVVFSFLNLLAHAVNIIDFRKNVPSSAPLSQFWQFYGAVCINAWIWSIVFHARDTPWTEMMDYFCAFSMVLLSLFGLLIRMCGRERWRQKEILGLSCIGFFCYHIWYLTTRSFDYGYNMKVNIIVGVLNGFGWLVWACTRWTHRKYIKWCMCTMLWVGASMTLELGDFPPLFWMFDAHALWHFSTAVLPFFWYRFLIGDCLYLLEGKPVEDFKKQI